MVSNENTSVAAHQQNGAGVDSPTQSASQTEGKGVRILSFFLPTQSPWLNPIEPKWVHAKKVVVEPDGLLSARQLAERICAHFGCSYEPPLTVVEKAS
jgi:hypothetical protein